MTLTLLLTAGAMITTAAAADTDIEVVPTNWRLQQYGSNNAVVYFSGSTCVNGQINVPPGYNADDISRFWATVLTAKALGKVFGLYYDGSTPQCFITSYYLREG